MTPMKKSHALFFALFILLSLPAAAAQSQSYDNAARSARRLLENLVAANTSNPPGNEARAASIGAERLKEAGIAYEITEFAPGRQNLTARLKGTGKRPPLLLLAHTDVVGADGQDWSSPAHRLTEKDGYLIGRGVSDDLGMAAVALEVLILLKRSGEALQRDVILAWTGDEESGGSGIVYLLKHKPASIRAELALNEGGGVILGEDGKPKLVNLQMAEKIYEDFELVARGTTGHSSVPLSDNAIYRLSAALERFSRARRPARLIPITKAYFSARAAAEPSVLAEALRALADAKEDLPKPALDIVEADPTLSATLRTTCVATTLKGGTRVNALPSEARANINCRILPDEDVDTIKKWLQETVADPSIEVLPLEQPGRAQASPIDGPGPRAIRAVLDRHWPGLPIIPTLSRGATDSRFLRAAGINAYGFSPIPISEGDGRRAHGVDERIPASSLRTGVEILHQLVLELAR